MTQNYFQVTSSAVSDRGLSEKRPQNEDSYLEMPASGLFAVADGVGGAQAGDVASQMAVEILSEAFNNSADGGDVEELMELAISRANAAIYQMSRDLPQLSTMATTIVALHIAGNIATIGHAGDSRLYRLDARGQLFRETQDHSMVEEEVRAGRLTPEQAAQHPSKNVISRALGAESGVEVDLKTIMFDANTTFLLCSDGVTRHISDREIGELLRSKQDLPILCRQIKEVCYSRGAEDNLTAVLVRVTGEETVRAVDYEENTVAVARAPLAKNAVFAERTAPESDEIPTQNLRMPAAQNTENGFSNNAGITVAASGATAKTAATKTNDQTYSVSAQAKSPQGVVEKSDPPAAPASSGLLGKLLFGLLGLFIGGMIGAAAIYLLQPPAKPDAPIIAPTETIDIPFSAFEKNRRNVDRNPAQFITASAATAEDAADFYLLGRAYLLAGKYPEAREALTKAKSRLPLMTADDRTMLANEIAVGLAAIESPNLRKILETEKTDAAVEVNSNVNTAN